MGVNQNGVAQSHLAAAALWLALAFAAPGAWAQSAPAAGPKRHHPHPPARAVVLVPPHNDAVESPSPQGAPGEPAVPSPPEATERPLAHAAPKGRVEHDVPAQDAADDEEKPIEWAIRDGRMQHRPQVLSVDLGIWPDTFSMGLLWASPVLPRGFIRHVNDSFDLEFGLLLGAMRSDWYWADGTTSWQLWPAFGGRWNFFLTHNWSTFITVKLAARIGLSGPSPGWFDVLAGAGASYRIKERMHLRLELNYPQGAVVGLSFPIGAL